MRKILSSTLLCILLISLGGCGTMRPIYRVRVIDDNPTNTYYKKYMSCLQTLRNSAFKQDLIKELCQLENL